MRKFIAKDGSNYSQFFEVLYKLDYNMDKCNNEKFKDLNIRNGKIYLTFDSFLWFVDTRAITLYKFYDSCLHYLIENGYDAYIKQRLVEGSYEFTLYYTVNNEEKTIDGGNLLDCYYPIMKELMNIDTNLSERKRISKYC